MELDKNCFYCMKDERLYNLMIEICQLDVSTLYLFKEQTHRGRCVVAYNRHETELFKLSKEERDAFMADVARAASAIYTAFKADKMNYGAYGDKMPHLHMHLVPKYEGGENWGSTFEMNPGKTYLSEEEYQQIMDTIKKHL